jgi:hypothetical protein
LIHYYKSVWKKANQTNNLINTKLKTVFSKINTWQFRSHHVDVRGVAGLVLEVVHHPGPGDLERPDPGRSLPHLLVVLVEPDAAPRAELPKLPRAGEDGEQLLPGQVGPVEAQRPEPRQRARQHVGILWLDGAGDLEAGEIRAVLGQPRSEGGEYGARLGVELEVPEERPPRDELRQARLVGGGQPREREPPQPQALEGDEVELGGRREERRERCQTE